MAISDPDSVAHFRTIATKEETLRVICLSHCVKQSKYTKLGRHHIDLLRTAKWKE